MTLTVDAEPRTVEVPQDLRAAQSAVADERTATGGGPSRRLRREGRVPGVMYQSGGPSVAFSLPDRDLRRTLGPGEWG